MELLRRNAGFRLLFLATLGSLLGTWLATIALTVEAGPQGTTAPTQAPSLAGTI